jgi:hypothetical protein
LYRYAVARALKDWGRLRLLKTAIAEQEQVVTRFASRISHSRLFA